MKKKYIIDLNPDCVEGEYLRIPARIAGEEQWLVTKAALTPYTEPDLEQVRKEAYDKGYADAKGGYENGFENGMIVAWEAARKISTTPVGELKKILDIEEDSNGMLWPFHEYTAAEAIEKLKACEQEQEEIKVGDEVLAPFGTAVVTNIVDDKIWFCYADGHCGFDYKKDKPRKTGRHFPEIATVLAKMRENT